VSDGTAVYRLYDADGGLLYIGCSSHFPQRWYQHSKDKSWWPQVAVREITWYGSYEEAVTVERAAILDENPLYNKARIAVFAKRPPPPVWEPLPADLAGHLRRAARRAAKDPRSRDRLGALVYKALCMGCRPWGIRRATEMSYEMVMQLKKWYLAQHPDLPPPVSRHGTGSRKRNKAA